MPVTAKMATFDKFFVAATGHGKPFDYQARLAGGNDGTACESKLINPESIRGGKTAAVVLAWLWNRIYAPPKFGTRNTRRLTGNGCCSVTGHACGCRDLADLRG